MTTTNENNTQEASSVQRLVSGLVTNEKDALLELLILGGNKTDPSQARVDALLKAFEIVQRLAEWSAKYPRQQVHSFSAKVDEQLIEIENAAKAWLDGQNNKLTDSPGEAADDSRTGCTAGTKAW